MHVYVQQNPAAALESLLMIYFIAFASIVTAVIITMVAVGVQNKGGENLRATIDTDLFQAFSAVTNIVFAYCAHVAFFGLLAEMEEPRDFPKALVLLQTFEICFYTVAAVVIYYFVGQEVTSPALGSAGPILKKVAYGIAIPTVRFYLHSILFSAANILTDHRRWCRQRPHRS
jgi:amino acid permease